MWCFARFHTICTFYPLNVTGLVLYPLEASENLWFSVFRGYRKKPVAPNKLKTIMKTWLYSFISGIGHFSRKVLEQTQYQPHHFCWGGQLSVPNFEKGWSEKNEYLEDLKCSSHRYLPEWGGGGMCFLSKKTS